ncbi:hypothetical protein ABT234_01280 [Streptomyces sp. NPDC001586]|uniref:hypothetical protein n=1 Tax=unclassified Streptomyces TaxID=2593676 RepID=UPI0033199EEC
MSLSLARCVEAVARLLDACGPLEPVRLCMSEADVQAEVCASGPAASVSMARLAAACGEAAGPPDLCAVGVLTVDLEEELVLVAAVDGPVRGAVPGERLTSTAEAAGLLRTLAPWAAVLDQERLPGAQLWVEDDGRGFTVRLLATAASGDDVEMVAAAAGAGLERIQIWRSDSGLDGQGCLPCGRTVHLGVVPLS